MNAVSNAVSLEAPQADRLEGVIGRVRSIVLNRPEPLPPRHARYYERAAVILGWLTDDGRPTASGEEVAHAEWEQAMMHARVAFIGSDLGKSWLAHAGVERIEDLDPASAAAFLAAVTDLSESTIARRAGTLRQWLITLTSIGRENTSRALQPELRPEVARFLASPVEGCVPTRMANWCARKGVTTFRELIEWAPVSLLEERNLGRTSIRKTGNAIEDGTGMSWEKLRAELGCKEVEGEGVSPPGDGWNDLAARCDEALLARRIGDLALPTRMRGFCERMGIATLGELLGWRRVDLAAERNLGRRTITQTRAAVLEAIAGQRADPALGLDAPSSAPSLDDFDDLLALLKARFAQLPPVERLVITRRAGLHGPAPTLSALGTTLGVSRERVRQLEAAAARRLSGEWWSSALQERLRVAVPTGARSLTEVAESDAFFADLDEHAAVFDFVLQRVLDGVVRVVELDEPLLVAADPKAVTDALADAVRTARELVFPVPLERVLGVVRHHALQVQAGLEPYFERAVRAELVTVEEEGAVRVVGVGRTNRNQALAFLEEVKRPVRLEELHEHCGGRVRLPDEAIYVARGWVALPAHIPDFDLWTRRLVPLCIAVMRGGDPGRQWSVVELHDEVAQDAQLPEWLGHWHLAGMLRASGLVRYLGRLQVALEHEDAPAERLHVRALLVRGLRAAGGPRAGAELVADVLRERGGNEAGLRMALLAPPFVQLDRDRFGLVDRDVPGGIDALAEAEQALEDELEERERGMSPGEALELVRGLSAAHADWTFELVKTVARHADGMRLSRAEGIGLSDWDDARLPTRRGVIEEMVAAGGGRAPMAALQDRIEREFGARPHRGSVANIGSSLGLVVRGDNLVREEPVSPLPLSVTKGNQPAGLPRVAVPLFQQLASEEPGDFAALRARALAYPVELETQRTHERLDPAEARAAAEASARLIDAVPEDPAARRLVWAAVRYFVEAMDGEPDFAVGGLDDDMDVLDAVADHLELAACRVERPAPPPLPAAPGPADSATAGALASFERMTRSAADAVVLRRDVAAHLAQLRKRAEVFELLPLDLAEELAARLDRLLVELASLDERHRALVVGAARYFVSTADEVHDLRDVFGLDDDVSVFNHAARQMGRDDLLIEL